jgi:hypothetical protein
MEADAIVEVSLDPTAKKQASCRFSAQQLYETLPLPSDSHCIRLLDIDPLSQDYGAASTHHITGHLRAADLQQRPKFLSLSYVWGEKESTGHFVALPSQGCNIEIPESSYEALKHLRDRLGSFTIWVDSICINQENDREKERQISLMQEIYSLADWVCIWLGPGNEVSDKAMDYMNVRASLGRRMPLTFLATTDPKAKVREYRNYKRMTWTDMKGE